MKTPLALLTAAAVMAVAPLYAHNHMEKQDGTVDQMTHDDVNGEMHGGMHDDNGVAPTDPVAPVNSTPAKANMDQMGDGMEPMDGMDGNTVRTMDEPATRRRAPSATVPTNNRVSEQRVGNMIYRSNGRDMSPKPATMEYPVCGPDRQDQCINPQAARNRR